MREPLVEVNFNIQINLTKYYSLDLISTYFDFDVLITLKDE